MKIAINILKEIRQISVTSSFGSRGAVATYLNWVLEVLDSILSSWKLLFTLNTALVVISHPTLKGNASLE